MPNQEEIQLFMQNLGPMGWLLYLFWGTLSVVFTPLNFSIVGLSAGFAYGTILGGLGNWLCKVVGTSLSFLLARTVGRTLVQKLISKKILKKYDHLIQDERTILLYAILCFIPFTPSDTLAYIVGLSALKKRAFFPITIIANSGTAFSLAYIGSGGALENPWFLGLMGVAILGGLYTIHRHQRTYGLHQ